MTADASPHPVVGLVLDSPDPPALAPFWAAALGYEIKGAVDNYTLLLAPEGHDGPKLLIQRVPEPKAAKLRLHLDVHVPDIETEADRLVALGGRRLDDGPMHEHGSSWIRMTDPEGNEFCVCDSGTTTT